jgi:biotin carboxyl carrier protein
MQGTVVRMLVDVGDEVLANQDVCVVEAMKMENVVKADVAGRISEVLVASGETIDPGRLILVITH